MADPFAWRTRSADGPAPVRHRPDCTRCPHSRQIATQPDRISCEHPAAQGIVGSQEAHLAELVGYTGPLGTAALGIVGDPIAITRGDFAWPTRYDPKAIQSCAAAPPPTGTAI